MLRAGEPAPVFVLPDAEMAMVELGSFLGKYLVLYFFVKVDTPGCTQEAIEFSDHDQDFAQQDCVVVGISRDDCIAQAEFQDHHGLSITLLSDAEGEVCRRYGVWQEQHQEDGQVDACHGLPRRRALVRSTFVIDRRGIIRHALYGVNPRGHAAEILKLVRQLEKGTENANRQEHRGHP